MRRARAEKTAKTARRVSELAESSARADKAMLGIFSAARIAVVGGINRTQLEQTTLSQYLRKDANERWAVGKARSH